jgi:hypothetical protein
MTLVEQAASLPVRRGRQSDQIGDRRRQIHMATDPARRSVIVPQPVARRAVERWMATDSDTTSSGPAPTLKNRCGLGPKSQAIDP